MLAAREKKERGLRKKEENKRNVEAMREGSREQHVQLQEHCYDVFNKNDHKTGYTMSHAHWGSCQFRDVLFQHNEKADIEANTQKGEAYYWLGACNNYRNYYVGCQRSRPSSNDFY